MSSRRGAGSLAEKHPHGRGEDDPALIVVDVDKETPPRAWGRSLRAFAYAHTGRNTPTGVGKIRRIVSISSPKWKHPHGRGEDEKNGCKVVAAVETPPRAWGR